MPRQSPAALVLEAEFAWPGRRPAGSTSSIARSEIDAHGLHAVACVDRIGAAAAPGPRRIAARQPTRTAARLRRIVTSAEPCHRSARSACRCAGRPQPRSEPYGDRPSCWRSRRWLSPAVTAGHAARAGHRTRPGEVLSRRSCAPAAGRAAGQPCATLGARPGAATCARRRWPGCSALPDGPDNASEPFALAVMADAARRAGGRSSAAATRSSSCSTGWARAGRCADRAADANTSYALDRTLLPTIVAFSLLRDDPELDPANRSAGSRRWLGALRAAAPDASGQARSPRTTTTIYLRGSVDMAWGALIGDDAAFERGLAAYRERSRRCAPTAACRWRRARGARALWYQRHAIASLVVIAEIAAAQGIDLYGLHRRRPRPASGAALPARTGSTTRSGVWPYAARPTTSPGRARLPAIRTWASSRPRPWPPLHGLGRDLYRPLPASAPESRRLLACSRPTDPDFRPMVDEYSGGNTTCTFAPAGPAATPDT